MSPVRREYPTSDRTPACNPSDTRQPDAPRPAGDAADAGTAGPVSIPGSFAHASQAETQTALTENANGATALPAEAVGREWSACAACLSHHFCLTSGMCALAHRAPTPAPLGPPAGAGARTPGELRQRLRAMIGWLEERTPEFKGSDGAFFMLADVDAMHALATPAPSVPAAPVDEVAATDATFLREMCNHIAENGVLHISGMNETRIRQIADRIAAPVAARADETDPGRLAAGEDVGECYACAVLAREGIPDDVRAQLHAMGHANTRGSTAHPEGR